MKVVTCFIPGQLRNETLDSIKAHWPGRNLRLHLIEKGDEFEYGRIIADYWKQGDDFAIVEPDIVIRKDVTHAFLNCECEYGCFPYAWTTNIGPALGCTWFRAAFLERYPTAVKEALREPISWRQFDVVLMRHVLARKYGEQPHVHLPAVEHLNEAKKLLPEADPTPMMSVPHW